MTARIGIENQMAVVLLVMLASIGLAAICGAAWMLAGWIANDLRAGARRPPPASRSVVPHPSSAAKGLGRDAMDRDRLEH